MNKLSLSNDTVQRRIKDISNDILSHIIKNLHQNPYFSLAVDESTDVSDCAQLFVFLRYIIKGDIIDGVLVHQAIESNRQG